MSNRLQSNNRGARGSSLLELAFVLLIIGVVFGVLWMRAAEMIENMDASKAQQELIMLVRAVRFAHPSDMVGLNETFETPGLTPDMIGTFRGKRVIYNPWHGGVEVFPGNAMGWGTDTSNSEFTVSFSGLSPKACLDLAKQNAAAADRNSSLVAMMFSPTIGRGREVCFTADSYCVNTVADVPISLLMPFCSMHNPMTVMFTFQAH